MIASTYARFWSSVNIRGPYECWEWTGTRTPDGYGMPDAGLQIAFGEPLSHRIACSMLHAVRAGAPLALHACDNPACCNPRHLRWGTSEDNADDQRVAEWVRAAIEARALGVELAETSLREPAQAPKQFRRGLRRVDDASVRAIRHDHANGMTARELAIKYGLTQSHADSIAKRRILRNVEESRR